MNRLLFTILFFLTLPLCALSKKNELLKQFLESYRPKWVQERLQKDFRDSKNQPVTGGHLKHFSPDKHRDNEYGLISIRNQKIHIKPIHGSKIFQNNSFRIRALISALKTISRVKPLPEIDFILHFGDGVVHDHKLPVFGFAKDSKVKNVILIPDPDALLGMNNFYTKIRKAEVPYKLKKNKAFWRGATTGGSFSVSNWTNFPRSQAVNFSRIHPNILDAKFTVVATNQNKEELTNVLQQSYALAPYAKIEDHLAFKFLPDIDGNSCTYSRLHWILYSDSLCLKQTSNFEQWYYTGIKAHKHFIPFKADMSDFYQIIQWAKRNDPICEKIATEATKFVKHNLSYLPTLSYFYQVLKKYESIYQP